ncbi:MAG: hypothetical protein KQ78_00381 [Candidatus Izimaplasma bacterium HR2]|nr:MAG: hypothetical protein KQ78_00381 [Candidatus Izimaplasma bacterium HR2]
MIDNKLIRNKILPKVKEEGRMLDYYLVKGLIENTDKEIINELLKFQNDDKGFGHGLEPDLRMPNSSVACTNHAVHILDQVKDKSLTIKLRKQIVEYYESVYLEDLERWRMTSEVVNDFPRAIWWNYETVDDFTYGNPNPEIIGFLYQNKKYLKKIGINKQINNVLKYIDTDFEKEASMHSVMSMLHFYKNIDKDIQNLIKSKLQKVVVSELNKSYGKWEKYGLEPYKIAIIDKKFLNTRLEELNENLLVIKEKVEKGLIIPNWRWYQFKEVFEECKMEWSGYLTFNVLRALRLNRL